MSVGPERKLAFVGHSRHFVQFVNKIDVRPETIYFDRPPSTELITWCESNGIPLKEFHKSNRFPDNDLVIMFECYKIIDGSSLSMARWLNIHSGVLPFWRGINANSWAIMHGAEEIGITLHEVTEHLDDGPIIHIEKIVNDQITPYYILKNRLLLSFAEKFLHILEDYYRGFSQPRKQFYVEEEIHYCEEFKKEDGIVRKIDKDNRFYVNLFRIFGSLEGSDMYLDINGKLLNVKGVVESEMWSNAPTGSMLKKEHDRFLIKTQNGAIWFVF